MGFGPRDHWWMANALAGRPDQPGSGTSPKQMRTRGGLRSRDLDVRTVVLCPAELLGLMWCEAGVSRPSGPKVGTDPTTSALPRRRSAS